ncbi:MAG: zinc metallopeptidase [Anaerolineae bacterium]|nr:zinc metallopeptidase [Anaerolineae bacterium]
MYYPIWYDTTFLLFIVPVFILGLIAQLAVQGRFNRYSQVRTLRGLTGAQAARAILDANGLVDVAIEETTGFLSDHYDPRTRTLRLSPQVARGVSVAAMGVAAHEAGHAIQHASGYFPLQVRSAIVPAVQFGSWLGPIIIIAGILLEVIFGAFRLGNTLAWLGVAIFSLVAVFAFITLPVELDASARARQLLTHYRIVNQQELAGVTSVLNAAAWTYVVAALAALVQVLHWVMILLSSRSSDSE